MIPLGSRLPTWPGACHAALAAGLALALTGPAIAAPLTAQTPAPDPRAAQSLERARELIEEERIEEARQELDPLFRRRPAPAEAYLLRATLHFMEGDRAAGRGDLDQALALDPSLREAWLNRAALDLAEHRLNGALEALVRARDLDPAAIENSLNIGAVLVLQGRLDEAARFFDDYLARRPGSAEAHYLVAANYGGAGVVEPAIAHLRQAIAIDERSRLRARTDANFADLSTLPEFERLLGEDVFTPPAGWHQRSRTFDAAFDAGRGQLLQAVMNALQLSGRPMEQRAEVTPDWALIWSDIRVKVLPEGPTRGSVQLSAPPERFSDETWTAETDALLREIAAQIIQLRRGL